MAAFAVAATVAEVLVTESFSWTTPLTAVVASATETVGAVAVPPMVMGAPPEVTEATLPAAAS